MAFASTAQASIVVGSDLSEPAVTPEQASSCAPTPAPCTSLLAAVKLGNPYPASSPADGTVVAFDIKSGGPSTVTFRVAQFDSEIIAKIGILAAGDGTGPTVELPGPGVYEVPTDLPIKAGEHVGIDSSLFTAFGACQANAYSVGFSPPLANGGELQRGQINGSCELLVNAVVVPSAVIGFGNGAVVDTAGRAKLRLKLPGPGRLTLKGRGIRKTSKLVGWAGPLNLQLRLTAGSRKRIANAGSASLKLSATFTPNGGSASTQSATVRFHE